MFLEWEPGSLSIEAYNNHKLEWIGKIAHLEIHFFLLGFCSPSKIKARNVAAILLSVAKHLETHVIAKPPLEKENAINYNILC